MIPGRDRKGIATAAFELCRASLLDDVRKHMRRTLGQQAERAVGLVAQRTLPDGYYSWALHLWQIETMLTFDPRLPLTAEEVEGLAAFGSGRRRFEAEHPRCARCDRSQLERGRCWGCGHEAK